MKRITKNLAMAAIGLGTMFGATQIASAAGALSHLAIQDIVIMDIKGFDASSLYLTQGVGSYGDSVDIAAGIAAMDAEATFTATSPIANGSEDTWGAARVNEATNQALDTIWLPTYSDTQLGMVFYGNEDFHMLQTGFDRQVISGVGMKVAIYEIPILPAISTASGTAGRTALDEYGLMVGSPVLVLESIPGHLDDGSFGTGGVATTFQSIFDPSTTTGTSQAYFKVAIGEGDSAWEDAFDQNIYGPSNPLWDGVEAADVFFTANVVPTGVSDWTVRLTDPASALVVPTPAAGWVGLAGFGVLGLVRRKRRA